MWVPIGKDHILSSADIDTDIEHDTDADMSTPIIIWENDIIQCNHKCRYPRNVCVS
jgi:hypothetical protein